MIVDTSDGSDKLGRVRLANRKRIPANTSNRFFIQLEIKDV